MDYTPILTASVGGVAALLGTVAGARLGRQQHESNWLRDRRLEAYLAFLGAWREFDEAFQLLHMAIVDGAMGAELLEAYRPVNRAADGLKDPYVSVQLLCGRAVGSSAAGMVDYADEMVDDLAAEGGLEHLRETADDELDEELALLVGEFIEAAGSEIGVINLREYKGMRRTPRTSGGD